MLDMLPHSAFQVGSAGKGRLPNPAPCHPSEKTRDLITPASTGRCGVQTESRMLCEPA